MSPHPGIGKLKCSKSRKAVLVIGLFDRQLSEVWGMSSVIAEKSGVFGYIANNLKTAPGIGTKSKIFAHLAIGWGQMVIQFIESSAL